jgi:hypothetical protein
MAPKFDYDLLAQLNDGTEVKMDPEVHGWAEPERLSRVVVWTIVPREGVALPVVTVQIPEDAKPIFKSRVYGKGLPYEGSTLPSFRAYAIGWHDTESHWTWVMPGGNIQVGEDPLYVDLILKKMLQESNSID